MLLLFFILFTTVLADSAEDKYVDLLPDEEKQQFLEKVARRILKDVESQEGVVDAQSGELNDEQLKQHSEYVRSVLKEEQDNIRRSKGDDKEKEVKPASEEANLGVKPLASLKVSLFNERQDLTLRKERGDSANKDNLTIDIIKDNAPIIKRSVQEDDVHKSINDELNRISQLNITSRLNELEAEKEKLENVNDAKALAKNGSEVVASINAEGIVNRVKPVEEHNLNHLNKSGDGNALVQGVHEGSRRSNNENSIPAGNVTESTTVSAVETVKPSEIQLVGYNNVSVANKESTTVIYTFETTSSKDNDTVATSSEGPGLVSTIEMKTNKEPLAEPVMRASLDTLNETNNEAGTTKSVLTRTSSDQEKTVTPISETTASVTNMTVNVPEITASVTNMTVNVPETTASVTNTTINAPETNVDIKIVRTETATDTTTFMTTEKTTEMTVPTTKETKIIVEDFPAASTVSAIKETKILKPKKPKELTTKASESEQSMEVTTRKPITNKIFVHKPEKRIVGPKAKKLAGQADKDDEQNQNFIELQKVFYNNNDKAKVGKEYHVFEVPADQSPFKKNRDPMAEQPYFVPIYNYSPNNAYYNPKNRLGPNPGDSSAETIFNDDDNNQVDRTETFNVKMEYDSLSNHFDSKRKKFSSKQKFIPLVNLRPPKNKEPKPPKGQFNPEDYLDSDYYFGRVRKVLLRKANEDFNKFPNSDETDHPAHSIQEGSLKDHVRAVRNILFHQKSFGLLEKDKYESIEHELGLGRKRSQDEEEKTDLRQGPYINLKIAKDDKKKNKVTKTETKIASDHYSGREKPTVVTDINQHGLNNSPFQKVGYLKKQNDTKPLYVMDDSFRANVEKYMKEKTLTPATPLPEQKTKPSVIDKRKEILALLRLEERKHKSEKKLKKASKHNIENKTDSPMKTTGNPEVIDLKVNVRRNDVVEVSVYLQVLSDMVTLDNKALVQYDWLGTTVDIQASLQKLFELTSLVVNEDEVHPADMEILKYVLFLHKLASEIIEANDFGTQLRNKLATPRSKKKQKKARLQEENELINKVWLYLRKEVPEIDEQGALKQLNAFLMDVEDSLYDLHDAIKNIAKITKYKSQHWYQNLKDLYIDTDEKRLLELLLHMSSLRLFSLIEQSAKEGLEDDYIQYMKQNRKHCKQTLAEMMFVMELLGEYNKFVE
ncbi:hypothetical protein PYW08_011402 [Mythimna loreyi]|uniref:Uncharacterized protein n=1 Tax=Mythimna loreyi TaxID=667449 RepID=A0ACC2Q3U0_9NEOP|nr:hypothetical protein PYW08_011402 [Mythimna loreyi]